MQQNGKPVVIKKIIYAMRKFIWLLISPLILFHVILNRLSSDWISGVIVLPTLSFVEISGIKMRSYAWAYSFSRL